VSLVNLNPALVRALSINTKKQQAVPIAALPPEWTGDPWFPPGRSEAPEIIAAPMQIVTAGAPRFRLSRCRDLFFFNLGGAYELVKLTSDVLEQYAAEKGLSFEISDFQLRQPLFTGLKEWSFILQALPLQLKADFIQWTEAQTFIRKPLRVWWRLRHVEMKLPDPGVLEVGGTAGPEDFIDVSFFMPFGNRGTAGLSRFIDRPFAPPVLKFDPSYPIPDEVKPPSNVFN